MASTTFSNGTTVEAAWLNDINTSVYSGTTAPVASGFTSFLFGRTAAEISAGVTPTTYAYLEGDPRRYGGVPDWNGSTGTDNSTAFRKVASVINAVGRGTIDLGKGRWRVFSDASTSDLFALSSCTGVTIKSDGAEIIVDRTFTGSQTVQIFTFTACTNVTFSGAIKATCTQAQPASQHTSRGPEWVELLQGCNGFKADSLKISNFREGYHSIRAFNDPISYASRNLDFGLIDAYQTGYPLALSLSGYNVKATIHTEECGRSYFPTGGENHDIVVRSKNHQASVDCLIATDRCNDSGSSLGAGMNGLRLHYTNIESTGADNSLNCVQLDYQSSDVYVGSHRNIEIILNIKNPAAGNYLGFGFCMAKHKADDTADTTDRGHILENLTVSGTISAASVNQRSVAINAIGTFGVGDYFRNIKFTGLRFDGTGQPTFTLTALQDVCLFSNYYYTGQTNITGSTTNETLVVNSYSSPWATTGAVCFSETNGFGTATALLANTNNWNIGAQSINFWDVSSDAGYNVTGIVAGSFPGQTKTLYNSGAFTLTLVHNSGSSTAGNKLFLKGAANFALAAKNSITLRYDGTQWVQAGNT